MLRRAMGKKKADVIAEKITFKKGEKGHPEDLQDGICLRNHLQLRFNRSAQNYSIIAYQTIPEIALHS
jgi:DNA polymerase III alpha subunit